MVQSWSLCAEFISSVLLLCSLRPGAVSGPRWFTVASAADLTGEPPLLSPDQMSILHSDHSYERQRGEGAEWKQGIARWGEVREERKKEKGRER